MLTIKAQVRINKLQFFFLEPFFPSNQQIHQFLFKCSKCLSLGFGKKVYITGMINKHKIKIAMILNDATIPNSFKSLLLLLKIDRMLANPKP